MPQFKGATYFSFKGGLNTEASPLNIPVTDALAVQNVDINIDGSIRRRRAIDFLGASSAGALYETSSITDYTTITGTMAAEVPSMAQFSPSKATGELDRFVIVHFGQKFSVYSYPDAAALRDVDSPRTVIDVSAYSAEQSLYRTTLLPNTDRVYTINRAFPLGHIQYVESPFSMTWVRNNAQHRVNDATTSTLTDIISDDSGWGTGCLSNSRLWVANGRGYPNTVFFSQTISTGDEYPKMYQAADPFSVSDNQLVDTDGGSITLTGAEKILALAPLGSGVIVFANNGVWSIAGQDGFRPTSYSINKISDSGIIGPQCWTAVEQQIIYFGDANVYTILLGTAIDTPEVQVIGDKISTFYTQIPRYNREAARAIYNPDSKKVLFVCNFGMNENLTAMSVYNQALYARDALVMDVRLAAWYTYSLGPDTDLDKPRIADVAIFTGGQLLAERVSDLGVYVLDGGALIDATSSAAVSSSLVTQVLLVKRSGVTWKFAFGQVAGNGVTDFASSTDGDSENNSAYITFAYQVFNDVAHKKFAPYLIPIFKRIETGTVDGSGVDSEQGGCLYRIDWDWAETSQSKKFGTLRQAYRPYRYTTSRFDGTSPGTNIVTSRLKIRGRGDVMRIHFESEDTKDFLLYGWQLLIHAKPRI